MQMGMPLEAFILSVELNTLV